MGDSMKKFIIKKYIDKLSIQNINNFALNNNIVLSEKELEYMYNLIKNNWEQILNNVDSILLKLNGNVDNESIKKIEKLYYEYKKKYKDYLI